MTFLALPSPIGSAIHLLELAFLAALLCRAFEYLPMLWLVCRVQASDGGAACPAGRGTHLYRFTGPHTLHLAGEKCLACEALGIPLRSEMPESLLYHEGKLVICAVQSICIVHDASEPDQCLQANGFTHVFGNPLWVQTTYRGGFLAWIPSPIGTLTAQRPL